MRPRNSVRDDQVTVLEILFGLRPETGEVSLPDKGGRNQRGLGLVTCFAAGKRARKIEALMPATFRVFSSEVQELLEAFWRDCPQSDICPLQNANEFAEYVEERNRSTGPVEPLLLDLVRFEIAYAALDTLNESQIQGLSVFTMYRKVNSFGVPRWGRFLELRHNILPLVANKITKESVTREDAPIVVARLDIGSKPRVFQLARPVFDALVAINSGAAHEIRNEIRDQMIRQLLRSELIVHS